MENDNLKNVNLTWFPGHMAKAIKQIQQTLQVVDVVILIGDGRAPISSFNHVLDNLVSSKKKVIIFSKKDLCDLDKLNKFILEYKKQDINCICMNLKDRKDIKELIKYLENIKTNKDLKYLKNGLVPPAKRCMIIGIPNVGKSTLINSISEKNRASVANKPGHTKAQQLIKVSNKLEFIDTPGILQPNYENKQYLINLSLIGSIKDEAISLEEVYPYLVDYLLKYKKEEVYSRYNIPSSVILTKENFFNEIALARHFVLKGKEDVERSKYTVLTEFRLGKLGRVCIDE